MSNLLSRDAYVYKNCYTEVLKWTNVKNAWDWQSNSWLGKMCSYKDRRGLLQGISCPGFHFPVMVNSRAFRGIVTDTTSIALNSNAIASILVHLYPPSSYCITCSTVLIPHKSWILSLSHWIDCSTLDWTSWRSQRRWKLIETGRKNIPLKSKDIRNYLENLRGL